MCLASVTDTILHLLPIMESQSPTLLFQQCPQCSQSLRSTDTARDHRQCPLTVRSAPVPRHRSEVFLSVPQRSPAVCPECLLSHTLRSSRKQCSAAALSTPLCFSPTVLPCFFRSPLSPLPPHLQCTSLSSSLLPPLRVSLCTLSSLSPFDSGMCSVRRTVLPVSSLCLTGVDLRQSSPCRHVELFLITTIWLIRLSTTRLRT